MESPSPLILKVQLSGYNNSGGYLADSISGEGFVIKRMETFIVAWENVTRLLQSSDESEREFLLQEVEQRSVRRSHSLLGEDGFLGIINLI